MAERDCQKQRGQRGSAVVEAAVILPLLILFVLAVVEVGDSLSRYYSLNQALREAVISVSAHPCVPSDIALDDSTISASQYDGCMSDPPTTDPQLCQTSIAGWRILRLLESLGLESVFPDPTLSIAVTSADLGTGSGAAKPCARAVSLSGRYRPTLTGLFSSRELDVKTRAVGGGRMEGP